MASAEAAPRRSSAFSQGGGQTLHECDPTVRIVLHANLDQLCKTGTNVRHAQSTIRSAASFPTVSRCCRLPGLLSAPFSIPALDQAVPQER